jgi:pilus assembly protein CpaF
MNTGHEGSMSTCHANSPRDALRRLETMVLFAETGLPLEAVRSQIAASLDLVVQVCRGAAGARQIIEVSEVGDDARSVVPVADHQRVIGPLVRPARSTRGGR